MNDDMRLRSAINLDELERQLREAAANRGASRGVPTVDDPLAELARLVGHAEQPAREQSSGYSYAGFGTAAPQPRAPEAQPAPQTAPYGYAYPQDPPQAAPAGAARQDHVNPYAGTDPYFVDEGALDPVGEDYAPAPKPRRTGMYIFAAMAVVAAGGVGVAAYMKRDAAPAARGPAPVIAADTTPTKVPPPNPGGMEVPNQNTQIYNRSAPDDTKTAKVVPSEEQPVDVATAQRLAGQSPVVAAGNNPGAALGMGEAKKVRSLTVRPDGTVVEDGVPVRPAPTAEAARPASPAPAPVARPVAPPTAPTPTPTTAAPAAPARPIPPARAETQQAPVAAPAPAPAVVAAAPAAAPAPVRAPQPAAAPAPLPTGDAGSGDFDVQLGAPGSEAEAREAVSRLQQRFAGVIGGRPLSVRTAEVNGRTIYRIRMTGLSREDANGLCERLKAAGGQCFVARN